MNEEIFSDIIEIMFLSFLKLETDENFTFTFEDLKETVESRYHWQWDSALERRFQILVERLCVEDSILRDSTQQNKYIWQGKAQYDLEENSFRSICLTSSALKHDQVIIERMRILNVNVEQLYDDSKVVVNRLLRERSENYTNEEIDELPL